MMGAEDSLQRFAAIVERRLGLSPVPEERQELAALLEEKAHRRGAAAYLERLEAAGPRDEELRALAERLTVGETYFFRHLAQLEALVEQVLPATQHGGRAARVLSAGCSTGEEVYSLAILGQESARVDAGRLFLTGVDINPRAIERARRARYAPWALRSTPEPLRERWFQALPGGELQPRPEAREQVHFEERNLLDEDPGFWVPAAFDVILCRNVTIYFTPEATRAVIARLERALAPGGALFLGPTETLRGLSEAFDAVQAGEAFYYRRKDGVARTPGLRPRPLTPSSALPAVVPAAAEAPGTGQPEARSETGMARAWRLLEEERYAEAEAWLETLPEPEREQPGARLLGAVLHLQGGHFPEAERLGEVLASAESPCAAVHYLLGLCREQAGDAAGARGRYARAVHLEPTFALGHLRLGVLARRAGERPTARVELRLALTLLAHEQPLHLALFGGGFGRHGLMQVCQQELRACAEVA